MGASRGEWAIDAGAYCDQSLAPQDNAHNFATAITLMLYDDVGS